MMIKLAAWAALVVCACAFDLNNQNIKSVKGGQNNNYQYRGGDLTRFYGNNGSHGYAGSAHIPAQFDVGVCYIEVPTSSLVRDPAHVPAGNGSRSDLSRIRSCCAGYKRNIYNFLICDPVCKEDCVNALCSAPDTCTCFPDHVKNSGGVCVATCPIGCQNGHCAGGECLCKEGYKLDIDGKYCQPHCRANCGGTGNCTAPNTCECRSGFQSSLDGNCLSNNQQQPNGINGQSNSFIQNQNQGSNYPFQPYNQNLNVSRSPYLPNSYPQGQSPPNTQLQSPTSHTQNNSFSQQNNPQYPTYPITHNVTYPSYPLYTGSQISSNSTNSPYNGYQPQIANNPSYPSSTPGTLYPTLQNISVPFPSPNPYGGNNPQYPTTQQNNTSYPTHYGHNPNGQQGQYPYPTNQQGQPQSQPGYGPGQQNFNPYNQGGYQNPQGSNHQDYYPYDTAYNPINLYPYDQSHQTSSQCSEPCINGACVGQNLCRCHPGYVQDEEDITGKRCRPNCPGGCLNGFCVAPHSCACNEGYYRDTSVKGRPSCVRRIRRSADPKTFKNLAELLNI